MNICSTLRPPRARNCRYLVDDGETIGDSETIIAHLIRKYGLTIDAALGAREQDLVRLECGRSTTFTG